MKYERKVIDDVVVDRLVQGIPVESTRMERRAAVHRLLRLPEPPTQREIAKLVGVNIRTVATHASQIPTYVSKNRPGGPEVQALRAEIVRRYAEGQPIRQIAFSVDRSPSVTRRHLIRAGVDRRPAPTPREVMNWYEKSLVLRNDYTNAQ